MPSALEFDHATVLRSGRTALSDISLTFSSGSLTVVLGPNGAGKSTLLRAATGELKPARGRVLALGQELASLNWRDSARLRRRIGVMPQLPDHAPAALLSVREVVEISRAAHCGCSPVLPSADRDICNRWIERFGLNAHAERPYFALSGGEQRKTHLARIFAQEPDLILLDEPAGHLDMPSQDDLLNLLADVWRETKSTIVLVTHDLSQMPPETTHILLLSRGEVLAHGAPADTITDESLSRLFGEPLTVIRHEGRTLSVASRRANSRGGAA
ncbi:MAG: ABC transporter ATP-binding protein [Opitutaceae bacterium]|jgi:iron complex transport system ATP-binding protein